MESLRAFHNRIKSKIVEKAVGASVGRDCVLDIACGPASDVFKYEKCGIEKFAGVDKDRSALEEGNRRIRQHKFTSMKQFDLRVSDNVIEDLRHLRTPEGWPLVACQFALQYFMGNESEFGEFCGALASITRTGGIFFGSVMDADRLKRLAQGSDKFRNSACEYELVEPNRISFRLLGNTRYYKERAILEPAATAETIIEPMMQAGFRLLEWKNFSEYEDEGGLARDEDARRVSDLYCTFMFRKK